MKQGSRCKLDQKKGTRCSGHVASVRGRAGLLQEWLLTQAKQAAALIPLALPSLSALFSGPSQAILLQSRLLCLERN